MDTSKTLGIAFGVALFAGSVFGQMIDNFDTINPAWVVDRYAPAGFDSVLF